MLIPEVFITAGLRRLGRQLLQACPRGAGVSISGHKPIQNMMPDRLISKLLLLLYKFLPKFLVLLTLEVEHIDQI